MKTSTVVRNQVSKQAIDLIARLVELVPWPVRRKAMGDVTLSLLDSRPRVAEDVFGWSRDAVLLGMNESRTGIACLNDLSTRRKPKTEEKDPALLVDIREIMDPHSQAEPRLRTTLLYTNVTARAVYDALRQKGWPQESLPTVRTISNILDRFDYRLHTVDKSKVQKKRKTPTKSSKTSGK